MGTTKRRSVTLHLCAVAQRSRVVAKIGELLEAFRRFAPPHSWGLNRADEGYSRERVSDYVTRCQDPTMILTWRGERPLRYQTWLQLNLRHPSTVKTELPAAERLQPEQARLPYDLGDALVRTIQPDFAALGPLTDGERVREVDALGISTRVRATDYAKHGPYGLAVRTYFGPRLRGLFGNRALAASGCELAEVGDHLRLDLLPEPWARATAELLPRLRAADQALASSGVFAVGDDEPVPGSRWAPPPVG